MRRLIGLILLLALVFGAGWLIQNGYDRADTAGETTVFEPARSADESVPPPDVAEGTPAATEPNPVPESPAAGTDVASAPNEPEPEAPAAEPEVPPAEGEASAPTETPAPDTATTEEIELDTPPAADAVPTFDIVRVEPSGDTVIAGLAAPEATVEVLDGAEPVATAEANERGEWALVLETPLPPGTHDLAIRTTSPDKSVVTLSDQRVAVAVPENPGEAPLVVLNAPDAPSKVIQVPAEAEVAAAPETPATPETPEIAAAPQAPSTPEAPATAVAPQASTAPEPSTPEASAPEAEAPQPAPTETEIASVPPPAAEPAPEPATPPAMAPEAPEPPTATAPEPATPPAAEPEVAAAPPGESPAGTVPEALVSEEPPAVAETPASPPAAEEPKPPEPQVGVAAVEAETDGALYIAGTATTPAPVRVYVDDELVGEATPTEGGTWLIETEREMPAGDYTIRADQVEEGSGKVIVRAEVPFEREIEVAVLRQSNESADPGGAEVSGSVAGPMSVIIKRGDNLWRISREMYGHGLRYSTIYQANKDQIRNPNRIYPGQVFMLPQGDTAWQN